MDLGGMKCVIRVHCMKFINNKNICCEKAHFPVNWKNQTSYINQNWIRQKIAM